MKIMVSACLAGENCKYNGGNNQNERVLQSRSPSCGVKRRYDGTFTGKLVNGAGVAAQLLMENGFLVIDVEDLREDEESVNEQR